MRPTIDGVQISQLEVHQDERGFFTELMRVGEFPEPFVQSNHSFSRAGVLRGLHYHRRQADLWHVVQGEAEVGLVDLRQQTNRPPSMLLRLSGSEPSTLYIPAGVAHGFLARTDLHLIYWVTNLYDPTDESGIQWNDPVLDLKWSLTHPTLSARDSLNESLQWDQIGDFS